MKQKGQRLGVAAFKEFFKAVGDNKKVEELRQLYDDIKKTVSDLFAGTTKPAMIEVD